MNTPEVAFSFFFLIGVVMFIYYTWPISIKWVILSSLCVFPIVIMGVLGWLFFLDEGDHHESVNHKGRTRPV